MIADRKSQAATDRPFSLKLDFPVAVSELVMFPPSAKDPQD